MFVVIGSKLKVNGRGVKDSFCKETMPFKMRQENTRSNTFVFVKSLKVKLIAQ
jgi:hypothetical protein